MLKGILIIEVITLHFPLAESIRSEFIFPFWINFAVPSFLFFSGYVQSFSIERRKIQCMEEAYNKRFIIEKCIRFLLPYSIFFVFEQIFFRVIGIYTVGIVRYGLLALLFDYLTGGKGQGSYFVPIVIQMVFVFPLVYFRIKKHRFRGLIEIFLINLGYEVIKQAYGMNDAEYRLLIFRYLFIIGCGCYAALYDPEKKLKNILLTIGSMTVGILFIILFSYTSYGEHAKIFTYWQNTSLFTVLYLAPILFVIVKKCHIKCRPLEIVGKASFYIFLVQMAYYIYFHSEVGFQTAGISEYITSVLVCVAIGILFYQITDPVLKRTRI